VEYFLRVGSANKKKDSDKSKHSNQSSLLKSFFVIVGVLRIKEIKYPNKSWFTVLVIINGTFRAGNVPEKKLAKISANSGMWLVVF